MPFSRNQNALYWIELEKNGKNLWLYSQDFIFFITYKEAQYVGVLRYSKLERLADGKHPSLLGSFICFISYEENEVLWIWLLGQHSKHFIFFVTPKWAQ